MNHVWILKKKTDRDREPKFAARGADSRESRPSFGPSASAWVAPAEMRSEGKKTALHFDDVSRSCSQNGGVEYPDRHYEWRRRTIEFAGPRGTWTFTAVSGGGQGR